MTGDSNRCAIYTRKSSEEGLEQAFNSLDAQREAGLDYIKSQRHEGWTAITTKYDDGGFSGGTTERPGLQRLLADIARGRVDIVLVYKVDRLSRSLADFARLMQLFDQHKVSFVSVTQQFNTTTSMGRLTLNMLLSFAQFEREVTGERIRDKIAATKKKGVWVCGQPPLGYRVDPNETDRRLVIVPDEAKLIRAVYKGYLELGSLLEVASRVNAAGFTTRRWTSSKQRTRGGRALDGHFIYRLLNNPVYIGLITHTPRGRSGNRSSQSTSDVHTELYPGLHAPIIDRATWDKVQAKMKRIEREAGTRWTHTHLLKGKLRTLEGYAMSPGSVVRTRASGAKQRVAYYCSQKAMKQGFKSCPIKSINAGHIDDLVSGLVADHLNRTHGVAPRGMEAAIRDHWIREVIDRVVLGPDSLTVEVLDERMSAWANRAAAPTLRSSKTVDRHDAVQTCPFSPTVERRDGRTILNLHVQLKRHDGKRLLLSPEGHDLTLDVGPNGDAVPREHLVRAIGQAFAWHTELMRTRASVERLAQRVGVTDAHVHKRLLLTSLSPELLRAALSGTLGASVSLADLEKAAAQLDWSLQAAELGRHGSLDQARKGR